MNDDRAEALPAFNDQRVQVAYEILCSDNEAPDGEHWEGFAARRIVAALEPAPLTDERIDYIADLVVKGMPEGTSGFCKSWGWRQFARAILADCAGHVAEPAAPAAQSAEILPLDRPVDWHMDGKPITYRDCIRNQCGELALSYAEEIQRAALVSQKGA